MIQFGLHTLEENLNVGDVIQEQETSDYNYNTSDGYWVVIESNWEIKNYSREDSEEKGTQHAGISVYNGVVFSGKLNFFKIIGKESFADVALYIYRTNVDKHIADIQQIFILPYGAVEESNLSARNGSIGNKTFDYYVCNYTVEPKKFNTIIDKRHVYSDYSPKNNKCFVYPYNYLLVTNNQGSNNIYKYENFNSDKCVFENQFVITVGGSGRIVPKNYKGMDYNNDESIPLGKYPTCSWSSDAYTNWLAQNSINMQISTFLSGASIVRIFC